MSQEIWTGNAEITRVRIGPEDHGILTAWVDVKHDRGEQGFGGYDLRKGDRCARFISGVLNVTHVSEWEKLRGQRVRVRYNYTKIYAMGNWIEDEWFNPGDAFEHDVE